MKRWMVLIVVILLAIMVVSCSGTDGNADNSNQLIEPGEKIGNFIITTGEQGKFKYGFSVECSEPGKDNSYTCNAVVGDVINVSTGIYDTTGKGNLDDIWTHSNYQMYIDDRPVDLQAFGTIEYTHPQVGVIRFANVVIMTDKAGQITVKDSGVYDNGDPFQSTSIYVYTAP